MPDVPLEDLDLRLLRCFTVLAEHGHFGRAAAALHTSQSSLSRQIRRLETQVGVVLLDRSPRGNHLTTAGDVLLSHAKNLLDAAAQATSHTRAAARPRRMTVGYIMTLTVTAAVAELRRRQPDADIRALHLPWDEQHRALITHRVDAVITWMPICSDGLDVTFLHEENRVLLVPLNHRLADRKFAVLSDIRGEILLQTGDPTWDAFWRVDPRPDGSAVPAGPLVGHAAFADKVELVASGQAITIGPGGEYLARLHPGIVAIPLDGVEPGHVVLATRADERGPLVEAFREIAERRTSLIIGDR
jgi:DNA-binding transcriptional LysR family regulator